MTQFKTGDTVKITHGGDEQLGLGVLIRLQSCISDEELERAPRWEVFHPKVDFTMRYLEKDMQVLSEAEIAEHAKLPVDVYYYLINRRGEAGLASYLSWPIERVLKSKLQLEPVQIAGHPQLACSVENFVAALEELRTEFGFEIFMMRAYFLNQGSYVRTPGSRVIFDPSFLETPEESFPVGARLRAKQNLTAYYSQSDIGSQHRPTIRFSPLTDNPAHDEILVKSLKLTPIEIPEGALIGTIIEHNMRLGSFLPVLDLSPLGLTVDNSIKRPNKGATAEPIGFEFMHKKTNPDLVSVENANHR